MPSISVVVPAYNEEKTIQESLRRLAAYAAAQTRTLEIIISNDGSTDKTKQLVEDFIKRRGDQLFKLVSGEKNQGKGAAVRRGIQESQGDYVLISDADLSTPIKEIDKLLHAIEEGADIAIGSRALREKGTDVQQSFKRWLSGRVFNLFVQAVLLRGYLDTQCGFKCFKAEIAKELFARQRLDGFNFDVEVLYLAHRRGYKIKEVPVMWMQGKYSRVNLLTDSVRMVRELFYLRKIHR